MLPNFQGSNFNFYYILAPRFAYVLYMYRCDVNHLMNSFYHFINIKYVTNYLFSDAIYVHSIQLVDMAICRYQYQYGPHDFTNVVKDITQNHNATPTKLDINGKVIQSRTAHKGTQDSRKK